MSKNVTIIDYHCGNLKSVEQALRHCGAEVQVTTKLDQVLTASKLILPGVGAFPVGMAHLHEAGLVDAIKSKVAEGTPLLGICLGMQLLLEHSEEHGGADGLGLVEGNVVKMQSTQTSIKLPHIGWNKLELKKSDSLLTSDDYFYFVHSYKAVPKNHLDILATSRYEDIDFCSAIAKGNVWGVQFHPENSSKPGLEILRNFITLNS